ncbi:MAG TPA: thiamine phosphate synthase [Gemmatimonadaceae bacterium]|nr:thiamine phosphate synthase [Gemmatimonadaceae bacterium]
MIPLVHAVTSDGVLARADFLGRARRVMEALGPRGAVHLRSRIVPAARLYELAVALGAVRERTGAWVVINDRVDVACAARASAVQLTTRSVSVSDARRMAGTMPLGASAHAVEDATTAAADGADWIVVGHVFETPSHPDEPARGLDLVRQTTSAMTAPVIAIGGIKPQHVQALLDAGAHGVAAISGIWGASDAERAVADYLSRYERHHGQ